MPTPESSSAASKLEQEAADERARLSKHRRSPRTSYTVGPFSILWLDLWTNLYGLDFTVTVGRWRYSLEFGFGEGVRARRGHA